jgi:internalin A
VIGLQELDMRDNPQIKQLPPEIGQLRELVKLDLCGNKMKQLPREIGQLVNLNYLDVRSNQLTIDTLPR